MTSKKLLSIVIPVYNESANLEWHHRKIQEELRSSPYDYEVIYVNDGSRDNSLEVLRTITKSDPTVKFLSFSRNFGKEAATTAGLHKAKGDAVLIMDADGQHPIERLDDFVQKWNDGYQVVIGVRRTNTDEGSIKRYGSVLFYKLINIVSNGETIPQSTDFRLLDRKVVDEFCKLTEHNRITRGLIDWLGFKRTVIEFNSPARHAGNASYSFTKLVKLALHAFVSQTTRPLQVGGIIGAITMLLSALVAIFLIIEMFLLHDPLKLSVTGTAFLALFVSFLIGVVLICQWLLALYIESIHNETQNRPLYIIDEEK
jgi:glycosyltransferase involved in cell wall biosynthesis